MAQYKRALKAYVVRRWKCWLERELREAELSPGELAQRLADERDRGNRDRHPRQAVRQWLAGEAAVSPEMAFRTGEVLNESGIVALYASGHMADFLKTLRRLALTDAATAVSLFFVLQMKFSTIELPEDDPLLFTPEPANPLPAFTELPEVYEWDAFLADRRAVIAKAFKERENIFKGAGHNKRLFDLATDAVEHAQAGLALRVGDRKRSSEELAERAYQAAAVGQLLMRRWAEAADSDLEMQERMRSLIQVSGIEDGGPLRLSSSSQTSLESVGK